MQFHSLFDILGSVSACGFLSIFPAVVIAGLSNGRLADRVVAAIAGLAASVALAGGFFCAAFQSVGTLPALTAAWMVCAGVSTWLTLRLTGGIPAASRERPRRTAHTPHLSLSGLRASRAMSR